MNLMPTRYEALLSTYEAYKETGQFFLLKKGSGYSYLWGGDDLGLFFFVPLLGKKLGLSLDKAIIVFFLLIITAGFLSASFYFIHKSRFSLLQRSYLFASLLFLAVSIYFIGDVYVISGTVPLLVIPLFLLSEKMSFSKKIAINLIIGIVMGYANTVRAHSGTTGLVFIISYLLVNKSPLKTKILLLSVILFAMTLSKFHFNYLIDARNKFLLNKNVEIANKYSHVFWHNTFLGLGYVYNKYGIVPDDNCAFEWVKKIDANAVYMSEQYENILRKEYFKFVIKHPSYVLSNYTAKAGVILAYILFSMNIAVFFLKTFKQQRQILPFFVAIIFGVLPGFIFLPYNSYILGGISTAVLLANYIIKETFSGS